MLLRGFGGIQKNFLKVPVPYRRTDCLDPEKVEPDANDSWKNSPECRIEQVLPMTYTQASHAGKPLPLLLKRLRARFIRVWLRIAGPRWTVGSLAFVQRAEDGKVCLLKHKGRVRPWGLPGGLTEWPESPESALRRELREELRWETARPQADPVDFKIADSCVSENFSMLELVFSASRKVTHQEMAEWIPQVSEIMEISWFSAEEIEALEGILERHRVLLLRLLRRS
ncbi:MAG: NUDIX domain-containing protein [Proteobacteria bacterium]|nr:NUDIX domain-containing protein [Pseudomonadota bacterium]